MIRLSQAELGRLSLELSDPTVGREEEISDSSLMISIARGSMAPSAGAEVVVGV
jgi:hypothetical protein